MIQLDISSNTQCLQTPPASWFDSPDTLSPPSAPRGKVMMQPGGLSCLVLDHLELVSAPSLEFGAPPLQSVRPPQTLSSSSPLFTIALERMRNGNGLQKLLEQREHQSKVCLIDRKLAAAKLRALSSSEHDKNLASAPRVVLGRQAPARSTSGIARSA
jgi:hypothetical protein